MDAYINTPGRVVSYASFFQDHYHILQRWALQITRYDRDLSEDLLHDVFLRFSQRPDQPDNIESISAYLYAAMKNAYVSYLRRKTRMGWYQLSLMEHEFEVKSPLKFDPRIAIKADDDLRAICHFACSRKATSISASILILRFFHGYYSAEVARVINRSRNAVEARLLNARLEASSFLLSSIGPDMNEYPTPGRLRKGRAGNSADLLTELRQTIFAAVEGRCLTDERLRRVYRQSQQGMDRTELSHLVSCAMCLDVVNTLFRMPLLCDRHPLDSIGPQTGMEVFERNRSMAARA